MKGLLKSIVVITLLFFSSESVFSVDFDANVLQIMRDTKKMFLPSDTKQEGQIDEQTGTYIISFTGRDETGDYVDKIRFDKTGKFLEVVSPLPVPERIHRRLEKTGVSRKVSEVKEPDAKVRTVPLSDKIYLPINSIERINLVKTLPVDHPYAVSLTGKLIAIKEKDKDEVIIKDLWTDKILGVLSGCSPIVFSPDGKLLATHVKYKTLILWDVGKIRDSGKVEKLYTLPVSLNALFIPRSVVFSPDGKLFVVGEKDKNRLYDTATGKEILTFVPRPLTFSPDGKLLAIPNKYKGVMLIDVITGKEIKSIEFPALSGYEHYIVEDAAFSPDGKLLATTETICPKNYIGCKHKPPTIWNLATGEIIKTLNKDAKIVAFSPDGKFLVTMISYDQPAILYNLATGKEFFFEKFSFLYIEFSSDGKFVAIGHKLWSLEGFYISEFFKKDEFETTNEYLQRVEGVKMPYSTKITLGGYDADRGGFEITVEGIKAFFPMEREKAKEAAAHRDTVYISGNLIYVREGTLELADAQLMY